jgi:hypothetical protein
MGGFWSYQLSLMNICQRSLIERLQWQTEKSNMYMPFNINMDINISTFLLDNTNRVVTTLVFRRSAASMADGGLGRFLSLPDMTAGDETPIGHGGSSRSLVSNLGCSSSSAGDITASYNGSQTESGIELLIAGSPISDDIVVDTEILDYESDDSSLPEGRKLVTADGQPTAMDTSNIEKDRAASSSGST